MVTWPQGSSGQELDVVPQLESPSQARICLSSCCRTWELFFKSILKYCDLPPENFLFKQSFWNIEIGHLRTGEGRETPLQSARGVERIPWGKVKLTRSRSFLFLRSFGCNLHICQQHWLKDPKNRGYAEKKDGKEGRTDHSEAAMSNWSTDLKLCNSIE